MPRDNMASLIQRVARQARITFRSPAGPAFGENLHRLQQLLDEVRAEDLHLAPGPCLRALLRSRQHYTPASPPCLLSPHSDNLHQIDAVEGPAAFLDILAPPYDPEHGRDCHYYRLLEGSPAGAEPALPREVWLLETAPAADFWCGGEPYPGPRVCP